MHLLPVLATISALCNGVDEIEIFASIDRLRSGRDKCAKASVRSAFAAAARKGSVGEKFISAQGKIADLAKIMIVGCYVLCFVRRDREDKFRLCSWLDVHV